VFEGGGGAGAGGGEGETANVSPLTSTGTLLSPVPPFPSWPFQFPPQHHTVPLRNSAHECAPPNATTLAVVMPVT